MSLYLVTIEFTPRQIALFPFTAETVRIDSAHASDLMRDMLSAAPQSIQIVPFPDHVDKLLTALNVHVGDFVVADTGLAGRVTSLFGGEVRVQPADDSAAFRIGPEYIVRVRHTASARTLT